MSVFRQRPIRVLLLVGCAAACNFAPLAGPGGIGLSAGSFVYMPLVMVLSPPWAVAAAGLALLPTVARFDHPFVLVAGMLEALWLALGRRWTSRHAVVLDTAFWIGVGWPLMWGLELVTARPPRDFALLLMAAQAFNQWVAVVAAHFLVRDTPLGRWLGAGAVRRERLRNLVFDYGLALALLPLLLAGAGMSAMLWRLAKAGFIVIAEQPLLAAFDGITWIYGLMGLAGIIGAAILVARSVSRRLARPLEFFARNAAAQADRSAVAPVAPLDAPVPREFSQVFSAFNRLATRLRESGEALRRQNVEIDSRVAERTRELETARQAAEAANRSKAGFIATTSHEIRTPLNAMIGLADALAVESTDPLVTARLRIIAEAGRKLLTVTNDLIDLSRIETGKLEISMVPVDVAVLCVEIEQLFALRATQQHVGFRVVVASSVPLWVRTDPGRLRQVLVNLIGNALKFTSRGEVCLHVGATPVDDTGVAVTFSITDTGPGITPEEQARLFEPYVQLANGRQDAAWGSGLGLAISRQLVQLLGGTLELQSRQGVGTTFYFTLQLVRASPESAVPVPAPPRPPRLLRVLVADDNHLNQEVMRAMLEPLVGEVIAAGSAAEAVAMLERECFDVAFIDLEMPDADGFTVADAMRAGKDPWASQGCRLIAFSAYPREHMLAQCQASGFSDFLGKPVSYRELLRLIDSASPAPAAPADRHGG